MTNKLTDEEITELALKLFDGSSFYFQSGRRPGAKTMAELLNKAACAVAELQERRKADSEPVAWEAIHHSEEVNDEVIFSTRQALDAFLARAGWWPALTEIKPLYAAPQPVPVVPEEKPMPNALSMYAVDAVVAIAEVSGWNACRAAMLQGSQPVSDRDELPCAQPPKKINN